MERDWLNDWAGFFGAILSNAGVTPNGNVDTAQSSQLYDAMMNVSRAGGFKNATVIAASSTSLTAAQVGQAFMFTTASSTVTLPASGVTAGGVYKLHTSAGFTLSITGGAAMQVGASSVTSLVIPAGTEVCAVSTGSSYWVFGTGALKQSSSFDALLGSAYRYKLPSGIIVQGGITASVPSGGVVVTYPVAFPTAVLCVKATALNDNNSVSNEGSTVMGPTLTIGSTPTVTQAGLTSESNSGVGALTRVYWEATGY